MLVGGKVAGRSHASEEIIITFRVNTVTYLESNFTYGRNGFYLFIYRRVYMDFVIAVSDRVNIWKNGARIEAYRPLIVKDNTIVIYMESFR